MSYEGHFAEEVMQKQEPGKNNLEIADLMSKFLKAKGLDWPVSRFSNKRTGPLSP